MTRSERLTPVTRIAEKHEQDAVKLMGECQRQLDDHEKRLAELYAYRDEYRKKMQQAGSEGIDPSKLNDYNIFIRKLDEAIVFQANQVELSKQLLEQRKTEWMARRTRTKVLDKVVDKYKKEEQQHKDKIEQKEIDERAQYAGKNDTSE